MRSTISRHPAIDAVQVVIGEGQEAAYRAAIGARALPAPVRRRRDAAGFGGRTGSRRSRRRRRRKVLIHDAARPFLPGAVIDRLLDGARDG